METSPLVSIIIPVFNRESVVKRALDSALSQTYSNIEIVVCDNASTDKTWSTLQQYAQKDDRIKAFRNMTNVGPVRNWLECLKHVSGEYVKILWSDDSISPYFISRTLPFLKENKNVGFVYTTTRIIQENKEKLCYEWGKSGMYSSDDFIRISLFGGKIETPLSPGCAMFRTKDVMKNLRIDIPNKYGFNYPKYGAGNDLLLFLYACTDYSNFYFINEPLSTFYGGSDSLSVSNELSRYYVLAQFMFVKECGDKNLKNDYYSKLRFGFFSSMVKKEEYVLKWRIVLKTVFCYLCDKVASFFYNP